MFIQFIAAFISIIGFAVLFNIPRKSIAKASFAGAIGWIAFVFLQQKYHSIVLASFIGASIVATISEIFARIYKEAVTVFVIPGILPLVPGSGMYYTMVSIIEKDFDQSAIIGTETLFIAGSISTAILIISSLARMLIQLISMIRLKTKK